MVHDASVLPLDFSTHSSQIQHPFSTRPHFPLCTLYMPRPLLRMHLLPRLFFLHACATRATLKSMALVPHYSHSPSSSPSSLVLIDNHPQLLLAPPFRRSQTLPAPPPLDASPPDNLLTWGTTITYEWRRSHFIRTTSCYQGVGIETYWDMGLRGGGVSRGPDRLFSWTNFGLFWHSQVKIDCKCLYIVLKWVFILYFLWNWPNLLMITHYMTS
jgi:hypothetical protein